MAMKDIQFVTDETGKRTAVLISLEAFGDAWEDIYDVLVSHSPQHEPSVPWEDLKAEMARRQKNDARPV